MSTKTKIVDAAQVKKIIRRMAYQIYERNFEAKELVLAAITGQGIEVSKQLAEELGEISKIKVQMVEILIHKESPTVKDTLVKPDIKLSGKTIIMVDDVLNTGRTLVYAMIPFLEAKVKSVQVAVLVDRNHPSFPVNADYKGISLQTTLQEHVSVEIEKKKINVYLT
jgi:pyrimidine operon attenuation protein / uracil phosphoribosyltransferase